MEKLFLVLFEIGFGFKFHFFGDFSVTETFLLLSSPYYINKIDYRRISILKTLSWLYAFMIAFQCLSELLVGNSFNNAARGIAVNVFSYLHIIFLSYYLLKDRSNVGYFALGLVLKFVLFGGIAEDEMLDEDSAFVRFLKFTLIPIINYSLIYIYAKKFIKNLDVLVCILGAFLIVLGSRSGGGIIFITAVLTMFFKANRNIKAKHIWPILSFVGLLLYGCYVFYVNQVLSGEIVSGNSEQLLRASNPYNPIGLLMVGRSEVFVGFVAFIDRFWTGWGAWTSDPGMHYHMLQSNIANSVYNSANTGNDVIPSHSVLIGSGMMNGIFVFILMFSIFIFVLNKSFKLFVIKDKYLFVIMFFVVDFFWNMLFSPQSAFRYYIPLNMAFLLVSYQQFYRK